MEAAGDNPIKRTDALADALSRMAATPGYGVAAAPDRSALGLYRLSDEKKSWTAALCCVPLGDPEEPSAEALLRRYESRDSWTAYFYDSWDGVTFPGGTPEEIELKAAVGVEALFRPFCYLENFLNGP